MGLRRPSPLPSQILRGSRPHKGDNIRHREHVRSSSLAYVVSLAQINPFFLSENIHIKRYHLKSRNKIWKTNIKLSNPLHKASIILIMKPGKSIPGNAEYRILSLMNVDTNILNTNKLNSQHRKGLLYIILTYTMIK